MTDPTHGAELLEELHKIPQSEWAKIYVALNAWKWPEQLNHIKPEWWDNNEGPGSQQESTMYRAWIAPLHGEIKATIGEKACNREWNRESMTDEQHEAWWNNRPAIAR